MVLIDLFSAFFHGNACRGANGFDIFVRQSELLPASGVSFFLCFFCEILLSARGDKVRVDVFAVKSGFEVIVINFSEARSYDISVKVELFV